MGDKEILLAPKLPRSVLARIQRHREGIAKHRDALREILDDIEGVVDSSDRAVVDLESAIDALSEYL